VSVVDVLSTPQQLAWGVKQRVDLRLLVGEDVTLRLEASTCGGEFVGACPLCGDGVDRLRVQPALRRWWCRQCSPSEHWRDAIDYVMAREDLDFFGAVAFLEVWLAAGPADPSPYLAAPVQSQEQQSAWRAHALAYVEHAEAELWEAAGERARAYLHARGLQDKTMRRYRLGFQPANADEKASDWGLPRASDVFLPRGLVIPWFTGGEVSAIRVRRTSSQASSKYWSIAGSKQFLFGVDHIADSNVLVLVEGEFDAMLVAQEAVAAGLDVAAIAFGQARGQLADGMFAYLVGPQHVVVAYDNDRAGQVASTRLRARWPALRELRVPDGAKDVTDYHVGGGDIGVWLALEVGVGAVVDVEGGTPVGVEESARPVAVRPLERVRTNAPRPKRAKASDPPAPSVTLPYTQVSSTPLPPGVVGFDLETCSAACLWNCPPEHGGFLRLNAYQIADRITVTTNTAELLDVLQRAQGIVAHNGFGYDLLALCTYAGADYATLAGKLVDTLLLAILADPPMGRADGTTAPEAKYGLDLLGTRLLQTSKLGDLKALARKHKGHHQIPITDAGYVTYAARDVELLAGVFAQLPCSVYAERELRIAAITARCSLSGFRVDVPLLEQRLLQEHTKHDDAARWVDQHYGPLPSSIKPLSTAAGKQACTDALLALGVEQKVFERTPNGALSLGRDSLEAIQARYPDDEDVLALAGAIGRANGARTVYQDLHHHLVGDRVHPSIMPKQASGRWSVTHPGLTVLGKRQGKYRERDVLLPELGHVLLAADLAGVDARCVAVHAQDLEYLKLFDEGIDIHTEIAVLMWGEAVRGDRDIRERAKPLSHGFNYGLGEQGMVRRGIPPADAHRFFSTMRRRFRRLMAWKERMAARVQAGELLDNGWGRLLRADPRRAWTAGPALVGQGCARDVLAEGLLRLPDELVSGLRAIVHDELVFSVPVERTEELKVAIRQAVEFDWAPPWASRPVRFVAELSEPGPNWGALYDKGVQAGSEDDDHEIAA
jgi:DNA polymerase I